ncbi:hypothetical protein C8R42DRAFT_719378 [Lentinula raphanica]|nr:hypothetical protein C8R42DRAFT_719378 [Lentinula raphanica]
MSQLGTSFNSFLPTSASLSNPDWTHITHATPELIAALRRLDLESRLDMNYVIEEKNRARRKKDVLKQQGLASKPGSPSASYVTIALEEIELIRTTPSLFDRLKAKLSLVTLGWMKTKTDEEKKQKQGEKQRDSVVTRAEEEESYLVGDVLEVVWDSTKRRMITIPLELMKAGQYFKNIPLPFFTNDALTRIKAVGKQLGIDEGDPMLLEDLSFEEFKEAAKNFCEYELKRSREKESGNRFIFASQHFAYFLNQDHPWKSYRYWKPEEFKLHEERAMFNYSFAMVNYNRAWDRAMLAQKLDEMKHSIQEEVLCNTQGYVKSSNSGLSKSRFSPYPPFLSSDLHPGR